MSNLQHSLLMQPFPALVDVEGIPVSAFPNAESLFERLVRESVGPEQRVVQYLNIHVANMAAQYADLRQLLQASDLVYCDGAGIVWGSRLLGTPLPVRLTAADWFVPMVDYLSRHGRRIYLLGGAPGVAESALARLDQQVPGHQVVGCHHGYILDDSELETRVIEEINAKRPHVLIVGFGTPLQERWIARNRHRLDVPMLYAIGAVMDFVSERVSRCPAWMGQAGMEWLYRLYTEPGRLGARYLLGNPWFLTRMVLCRAGLQVTAWRHLLRPQSHHQPAITK